MSKVSVIVPIFNSEKTLKRCIESIISQTYDNLEVILINDGSNDKSEEICRKKMGIDNRLQLINQKNSGVSEARNAGLEIATGEFVLFVDADDFIDKVMIERLVDVAKKDESDLVISGFKEYIVDGSTNRFIGEYKYIRNSCFMKDEFLDKFSVLYKSRLLSGPCNSLYRIRIIRENNIKFNRNLSYGEDTLFNIKYYKYSESISLKSDSFYNYVHANSFSLSQRFNPDKLKSVNLIYDKIRELLDVKSSHYLRQMESIEFIYFCHIIKGIEEIISNSRGLIFSKNLNYSKKIFSDPRVLNAAKYGKYTKNTYIKLLSILNRLYLWKTEFIIITIKSYTKKFLLGVKYERK